MAGLPPWIPVVLAGLLSGGLFLLPRALLVLSPAPLILLALAGRGWRGLEASGGGALLVGGAGLLGSCWAGGFRDAVAAYVLLSALPASLLVHGLLGGRRGAPILARAWVAWLGTVVALVALGAGEGNLPSQAREAVGRGFDAWVTASELRAEVEPEVADRVKRFAADRDRLVGTLTGLLPGGVAALGLLGMWMNLVYVRWFTGGISDEREDDLCAFRLPPALIWVVIVAMALLALWTATPAEGWREVLGWSGANALLFLGALYWLQGVAVVNWWYLRLPLRPLSRALGLGAQVMAMAIPVFSVGYLVAGLSDVWLDLRGDSRDGGARETNGAES